MGMMCVCVCMYVHWVTIVSQDAFFYAMPFSIDYTVCMIKGTYIYAVYKGCSEM